MLIEGLCFQPSPIILTENISRAEPRGGPRGFAALCRLTPLCFTPKMFRAELTPGRHVTLSRDAHQPFCISSVCDLPADCSPEDTQVTLSQIPLWSLCLSIYPLVHLIDILVESLLSGEGSSAIQIKSPDSGQTSRVCIPHCTAYGVGCLVMGESLAPLCVPGFCGWRGS